MESAKLLLYAKCLEGSDNPHPLLFLCQSSNPSFNVSFKLNAMSLKSKKKNKKKKLLTVDIVSVTLEGRQECRPRKQQRG